MSAYHQEDIRRMTWFGLRPLLARAATLPLINHALVATARRFPSSRFASHVPVARPYARFKLDDGSEIVMSNPSRCHIARELYLNGGALAAVADRDVMQLLQTIAKSCDLFLDIGAYSGLFALTVAATNPATRVVAYEILPENFAVLQSNILHNNFAPQIEARLEGVGEKRDVMRMPRRSGSWVLPSSISLGSRFRDGVDIPITTLDRSFTSFEARMAMKIDVEGFEREVLSGGRDLVARTLPTVICELLVNTTGAAAIEAMLAPLGYEFYQFTSSGPRRRAGLAPSRDGRDWLFIHSDRRRLVLPQL